MDIYYAYGSNMSSQRLRDRIPGAQPLGAARLQGWRILCNKPGGDGSGKANLIQDPAGWAWGVLYRIDLQHWRELDRFEPGYSRVELAVVDAAQRRRMAQLYLWTQATPELPMVESYRDHLVHGAREHGLPADYLVTLEALPVRSDA